MSSACLGSQESRRGRRVGGTEADWQRLPGGGRALVLRLEEVTCPWCPPGLSPDLQSMEQIRRIMRPTDVPDQGLLCDLLWSDPDKDVQGWGENDRGVSFTFGAEVVAKFLHKHDLDLICRAHQVGWQLWSGWQWGTGSSTCWTNCPHPRPGGRRWL